MRSRYFLVLVWLCLAALSWTSTARAEVVRMRSDTCYATAAADYPTSAEAVSRLRFDCSSPPSHDAYGSGWVWLKVRDPGRVAAMPSNWHLLIDQARFTSLTVVIVHRDGQAETTTVTPGAVGDYWSLGGMLRFPVTRKGAAVRDIYVGFERLDDLSLMRKLDAATSTDLLKLEWRWLALIGIFIGAIGSAFAFNLLIYTGQRLVFQRWYLVWSALVLGYGLSWTNTFAFVFPEYVGPVSATANYLLVSGLIAAGNMFFITVIEEGILPRTLMTWGRSLAWFNLVCGVLAAFCLFVEPRQSDQWLNIAFVMSALCVGLGTIIALRARSRVVWFYLAGWTPVLVVFGLRVSRNFGLFPQNDLIDMASFAALAFESTALALAIADRFRLLGRQRDAAEQARKVMEVESQTFRRAAQTDYLTGLGNRAAFQSRLRAMCADASRTPFMLLLLDVDHLKAINDRLGHDGGDLLLGQVGAGLAEAAGPLAHVSRTGGDEFAILLPWTPGSADGIRMRLEHLQGRTLTHGGRSWALSLSIGTAVWPRDALAPDVLVKNADLALYEAKQNGRRRLQAFLPRMREKLHTQQVFGQEARHGIERQEFLLHFQPIVDMDTGRACYHEALLRWQHPQHGMMTPATFGDMLNERTLGLMVQHHVLDMALAALRDYPQALPKLSINLIGAQLDGPEDAVWLLRRLDDFGVAPDRLCVEIIEDFVLGRAINGTTHALALLHEAGVTVALDDFGTGYASLIHLKHLPFDMLKIDQSFTRGLFQDGGQSEAIIRAIIGLGQGLGKQVVAEGVETQEQRRKLSEMGCRLGQGYLFARPGPILREVVAIAG